MLVVDVKMSIICERKSVHMTVGTTIKIYETRALQMEQPGRFVRKAIFQLSQAQNVLGVTKRKIILIAKLIF